MKTEVFYYSYNFLSNSNFEVGQLIGDRKHHMIKSIERDWSVIKVTTYKLSKKWWWKPFQIIYLRLLVL